MSWKQSLSVINWDIGKDKEQVNQNYVEDKNADLSDFLKDILLAAVYQVWTDKMTFVWHLIPYFEFLWL